MAASAITSTITAMAIDWVEVSHLIMHTNGYVRCPYEGQWGGLSWLLLRPTQEVTDDMKITDTNVPFHNN